MIWMRIIFLGFCILDAALALQLVLGDHGVMEYVHLRRTQERLLERIDTVSTHNMALSQEIRLLRKDPDYVQRVAKAELNFVSDGEVLYIFEHGSP
ncbi:FtsB family cell division protein [Desulfoplanes sp.]